MATKKTQTKTQSQSKSGPADSHSPMSDRDRRYLFERFLYIETRLDKAHTLLLELSNVLENEWNEAIEAGNNSINYASELSLLDVVTEYIQKTSSIAEWHANQYGPVEESK
jgi:hypothetical protein